MAHHDSSCRRTIAMGDSAWCRRLWLTDPSSSPATPPRPREPTTTRDALADKSTNWALARPSITEACVRTVGYLSRYGARLSASQVFSSAPVLSIESAY